MSVRTIIWVIGRVGLVAGNVEDCAHDRYVRRIGRVGACAIISSISQY